ncbi:hypothetical protein [Sphingomonas astaxanthinifaciens]|uniref:Uncharacterized protein n=1 Tax=Sphingomonas astaxanthinifaciens DSM 22298 TaxID=1123267 RepID=A0ABQ5Z6Y4_9SPHN|nr:hypothetical protein [Sphingomonas astaxanthinifaciens]GLR48535.1 hypothetical protein GCM10007925_22520 [Sphingomonas astaxanthinifaciens DSM 22298]
MFQALVLVGLLLITSTSLVAACQTALARRELRDSRVVLERLLTTLRDRL